MRYEETCSCGASVVVVDSDTLESKDAVQQRINKRVEEWRNNHNHSLPLPTALPRPGDVRHGYHEQYGHGAK